MVTIEERQLPAATTTTVVVKQNADRKIIEKSLIYHSGLFFILSFLIKNFLYLLKMSKEEQVNQQLHEIFDPENLKKDNFFRELVEKDPEGCTNHILKSSKVINFCL